MINTYIHFFCVSVHDISILIENHRKNFLAFSFLADFGLSKILEPDIQMQTVCGTPGYCGELFIQLDLY